MKNNVFLASLLIVMATMVACSPADAPDTTAAALAPEAAKPTMPQSKLELAEDHFHPKGKAPSEHTLKVFEEARKTLPFSDRKDFEEWERGFIARREDLQIMADAGNVAWDMERYLFLDEPEKINSVHPSLLRMSKLNNNFGVYEVIPGIYQVRGFDLAQITFIRGETGWIVFDPLTAFESSRAAKELLDEQVEELPIVAVVYSHSHGDRMGVLVSRREALASFVGRHHRLASIRLNRIHSRHRFARQETHFAQLFERFPHRDQSSPASSWIENYIRE